MTGPGGAARLDLTAGPPRWVSVDLPPPGAEEVRVAVRYIGVNRGEIALLDGTHVPAGGGPPVPGLECSGVVTGTGSAVSSVAVGQPVGCLVHGGAYATELVTNEVNLFPIPPSVPAARAAASLEAVTTAWEALVRRARVVAGEVVLVTGAAGSVGLAAISLARHLGAVPVAVCGAGWKAAACREAGAAAVVVGYEPDLIRGCLDALGSDGANIVLEVRGGDSVASDLEILATDGRIVLLGRLEGSQIRFDLARLNRRRASVIGFNLKERALGDRRDLFDEIRQRVWPHAVTRPWLHLPYQVDCVCAAAEVHDEIRARRRIGSSVLEVGSCGKPACPTLPA